MYMYTVSVGALIFALNDSLKVMLHVHHSLLVNYIVSVALTVIIITMGILYVAYLS